MTTPLDPTSIKTWEDAFQYPIPQVRQLERQLRNELSSNKEKLRGLVGESYRDLLKTAERIIEMDVAAHVVEDDLGDASRNCNHRLVDKKARNLKELQERSGGNDREKYTFAARLAVVQACQSALSQIIRSGRNDSCLLAAKLFVISRLLSRSFGEKGGIPLLDPVRTQLGTFRPILLQHVDTLLSSIILSTTTLISALTGFSILSTSPSTEVLRHFFKIRSTTISTLIPEEALPDASSVLKSLKIYNKTLGDVKAIFPKRLAESLIALKSTSLLEDPEVVTIPELGIEINGRWLPDDIRGFIPWVRHNDLEISKVKEMAKKWAGEEVSRIDSDLEQAIREIIDIKELTKLRSEILRLWRAGWQTRWKFFDGGERFREIIMRRVKSIVWTQVEGLKSIGMEIRQLLGQADQEDEDSTSIWSEKLLSIDLSRGAVAFRDAVADRVHGKSNAIGKFLDVHQNWHQTISRSATIIRDLRSENSVDPDEDEDFETEEERLQESLVDSENAEKELIIALDMIYRQLENEINLIVGEAQTEEELESPSTRQEVFLLRTIRQIRNHTPKRGEDGLISLSWFGVGIIPKLHVSIAQIVCKKPLETVAMLLRDRKWDGNVVSKPLWEGSPLLPVQPSPLVFRFLHDLVTAMGNAGEDIWTPAAVKCIKAVACDNLWKALSPVLESRCYIDENGEPVFTIDLPKSTPASRRTSMRINGDDTTAASRRVSMRINGGDDTTASDIIRDVDQSTSLEVTKDEKLQEPFQGITRDWTIQLLFDCLYLDESLHRRRKRGANGGTSVASLAAKVDSIITTKMHLDEELRMRLESSSSEYWKRTCLLFALLSGN